MEHFEIPARVPNVQLIFRREHRHPLLTGHPLVRTEDGGLTMLARQFARSDPNLMLSLAMNAGAGRNIYESIIEEIETATKRLLAQYLRERGYAVWDDPVLKRPGADPLTPDLVVSGGADDWIVVVECKHAIPPRGAAAASDRIEETSQWITKAQRYRDAADQQVAGLEAHLGIPRSQRNVFVAIVARWPMPVPLEITTDRVVLTDLSCVKLTAEKKSVVRKVFGESDDSHGVPLSYVHHTIKAGDWTYRHPILASTEQAGASANDDSATAAT